MTRSVTTGANDKALKIRALLLFYSGEKRKGFFKYTYSLRQESPVALRFEKKCEPGAPFFTSFTSESSEDEHLEAG